MYTVYGGVLMYTVYRRTGFKCETLIIANCEIISISQKLKRKQKFTGC